MIEPVQPSTISPADISAGPGVRAARDALLTREHRQRQEVSPAAAYLVAIVDGPRVAQLPVTAPRPVRDTGRDARQADRIPDGQSISADLAGRYRR